MTTFILFHVALSLAGVASGFVVLFGLLTRNRLDGWTAVFLATTVATCVSGFGIPADRLLPSHVVGGISLLALGVAIFARYSRRLDGAWRKTYVICAVLALYLNVFVGIVQAFLRVPALKAIAPTQSEPAFAITQLGVLVVFVAMTVLAAVLFRDEPVRTISSPANLHELSTEEAA